MRTAGGLARLVAVAILVAQAPGCAEPPPTAPHLRVLFDTRYFDDLLFEWTPPSRGEVTGYVLEMRTVPGEFASLKVLPASATSASHRFSADEPELTDYEFRLRVLPGETGSRDSEVVPFHRGLRPPDFRCANGERYSCQHVGGVVSLTMTTRSQLADSLVLEREFYPCGGPPLWESTILPANATSYLDDDFSLWSDGATVNYRLSSALGSHRSLAVSMSGPRAPLLAPTVLPTIVEGGMVRVAIRNESACATSINLYRRERDGSFGVPTAFLGQASAGPPGSVQHFSHAIPPPGVYEYWAYALSGTSGSGWNTRFWFLSPLPAESGLVAALVHVPRGTYAARAPSGAFATAERGGSTWPYDYFQEIALHVPTASGVDTIRRAGAALAAPGIVVDRAGHAHSVFAEEIPDTPGTLAIMHAKHDGTAWTLEEISRGPFHHRVVFALGLDGALHAVWRQAPDVIAGSRSPAGWALETVPGDLAAGSILVAGDESGGAHVIALRYVGSSPLHLSRGPAGWSSEVLPVEAASMMALFASPGKLTVLARERVRNDLVITERTSLGWAAPTPVEPTRGESVQAAAMSADGTRMALATKNADGRLWLGDEAGWTARSWLADEGSSFSLGFRPDGRAWLLDGLVEASAEAAAEPAVLFEEQ